MVWITPPVVAERSWLNPPQLCLLAPQTTTTMSGSYDQVVDFLQEANIGFDHLFLDEVADAKAVFQRHDSPFHLLGLGVCSFLEASLGMEVCPQNLRSTLQHR
jgi:hypothetical protein